MNLKVVYEALERVLPKDRHFCIQVEIIHYGFGGKDPTIKVSIYIGGEEWLFAETPEEVLALFHARHARHPSGAAGKLKTVADVQVPEAG